LLFNIIWEHCGVYKSWSKMRELAIIERYINVCTIVSTSVVAWVVRSSHLENIGLYYRFFTNMVIFFSHLYIE
jgi:hypothetical protein